MCWSYDIVIIQFHNVVGRGHHWLTFLLRRTTTLTGKLNLEKTVNLVIQLDSLPSVFLHRVTHCFWCAAHRVRLRCIASVVTVQIFVLRGASGHSLRIPRGRMTAESKVTIEAGKHVCWGNLFVLCLSVSLEQQVSILQCNLMYAVPLCLLDEILQKNIWTKLLVVDCLGLVATCENDRRFLEHGIIV